MAFSRIEIMDMNNEILFNGLICLLPIVDEVVSKRCFLYYNKEVCIVRRENMKRIIYLEIEEVLLQEGINRNGFILLPDSVSAILDFGTCNLVYRVLL